MPEEAGIKLTLPQLQALITTAIQEAKRPDADEQAKKDEAKALKGRQLKEMMQMVADEQANRERNQRNCGHRKGNGEWSTGGQLTNDGKVFLICMRCQKDKKFDPGQETRSLIASGDVAISGMAFPA